MNKVFGLLLLLTGMAWASPDLDAYYRGAAAGDHPHLPTSASYTKVYDAIRRGFVRPISDEELASNVKMEIRAMLEALHVDPALLADVPEDLDFPRAAVVRLEGKVSPGMVWLAACHGLAAVDCDSGFLSADEYDGIPSDGVYHGPPLHPQPRLEPGRRGRTRP